MPQTKSVCVVSFFVHSRWRSSFVLLPYIATPAQAIQPLSTLGWVYCPWRSSLTFNRNNIATPASAASPSQQFLAVSSNLLVSFWFSAKIRFLQTFSFLAQSVSSTPQPFSALHGGEFGAGCKSHGLWFDAINQQWSCDGS